MKNNDGTAVVCDDDQLAIWDFFQSLVKIAIRYIHKKRTHNPSFKIEVDLEYHCKKWNIDLAVKNLNAKVIEMIENNEISILF